MQQLPVLVESFFYNSDVIITNIDNLPGVNPGRGVFSYRLNSTNKSYILKNCSQVREFDLYTKHSSFFRNNGINIPEIYFSCEEDGTHWILIEDITYPFPKSRWKADSEQILLLYKLHSTSLSLSSDINMKDPYPFNWGPEVNVSLQHLLPLEIINKIDGLREQAADLFQPFCCISGDPNPTNWGVRENGELVLFDFERIGYGNPAIDLAITMPGFGSEDGSLEIEIAQKYLSHWHKNTFPLSDVELSNQLHLAKIWSSLDYLANNHRTMNQELLCLFVQKLINKIKVHS